MDGWAVLSALKSDPATSKIPVIILSMVNQKDLGYALGVDDYLTKPLHRERLISVLRKYEARRGAGSVLVIEDNPETREMTCRIMEIEGWRVQSAENGRAGLDQIKREKPAVIILDLMMPEMDGFEFVMRMQQEASFRDIPIVVLSAKDLTAQDRQRLNGHVVKILQKGTHTREQLLAEVNRLCGRSAS
jgi:CheY-like chemotaxis protein